MPERHYIPPPQYMPPTGRPRVRDRVFSHAADAALLAMSIKQGALTVLAAAVGHPGAYGLPAPHAFAVGAFMLVGAGLWAWTLLFRFQSLSTLLKWQRIGLGFVGLAWTGLLIIALGYTPPPTVSEWTTAFVMAVAAWLILALTVPYENRVHETIRDEPAE